MVFRQDEIRQATHVHGVTEFLPWHREIVNRLEEMLRQINPQLSLHYWDWTQDARAMLQYINDQVVDQHMNMRAPMSTRSIKERRIRNVQS